MKKIIFSAMALLMAGTATAQWNEEGNLLLPAHTRVYDQSAVVDTKGNMWTWMYVPSAGEHYAQKVQCVSPKGEMLFGEDAKTLCNTFNMSWTTCNHTIMSCSDGSVIVIAADRRDEVPETGFTRSYYAYRLDATGNQMWGEDGILINTPRVNAGPTHISMCELPNGNVAMAWEEQNDDMSLSYIRKQCVSPEGKLLYDTEDNMTYAESKQLVWPTLVSDEEGGYFMLYGRTENWYLYVQHFDADGKATWNSGFSITRKSGWSGMPMWFLADAMPSGDGGILVYWRDSRDYGPMYGYVACIDKEGKSKFVNATGTADCRINYSGMNTVGLSAMLSPDNQGYLVAMIEETANSSKSVSLQKISHDSEQLLGETGKTIFEQDEMLVSAAQLTEGPNGMAALMYLVQDMYNIDDKDLRIELIDPETGDQVSEEPLFEYKPWSEIGGPTIMTCAEGEYWMIHMQDAGTKGHKHYDGYQNQLALRINFDGTMGEPEADGISLVEVRETKDGIFNMQGQRVTEGRGLCIVGGKKYVVK